MLNLQQSVGSAPGHVGTSDGFGRLPSAPGAARRLIQMTRGELPSSHRLCEVIALDPALAARTLRLAQLETDPGEAPITSIPAAVGRVGHHAVALCALDFGLPTFDAGRPHVPDSYWLRCVVSALCSRALVRRLQPVLADTAYAAGLLADIGTLVCAGTPGGAGAAPVPAERGAELLEAFKLPGLFPASARGPAQFMPFDRETRAGQLVPAIVARGRALVEPLLAGDRQALSLLLAGDDPQRNDAAEDEAFIAALEQEVAEARQALGEPCTPGERNELLKAAADQRTLLVLHAAHDLRDLSERRDQLQLAYDDSQRLPRRARRLAASVVHVSGVIGVSAALLGITGIIGLLLLYLLKATLGIDLVGGSHLGGLAD